jgi:hypothetical protein
MKDKRYRYLQNATDCSQSVHTQIEIPLLIEKAKEKYDDVLRPEKSAAITAYEDAHDDFKFLVRLKKYEERKSEIKQELAEV